jgi:hypothetical protein
MYIVLRLGAVVCSDFFDNSVPFVLLQLYRLQREDFGRFQSAFT